jgi:hypothetical protein
LPQRFPEKYSPGISVSAETIPSYVNIVYTTPFIINNQLEIYSNSEKYYTKGVIIGYGEADLY